MHLAYSAFAVLPPGGLKAAAFVGNTCGVATASGQHIIYETDTGGLFCDADGVGGLAAKQFGQLKADLLLSKADFLVI